jgi:RNA polymerase sigma-70 factor (ECF subfamily)
MARQSGDTAALYEKYARRLMAYFFKRGLALQDAEDALQEVFKRLQARTLAGRAGIQDIERWLLGTARNVATDIFRRRGPTVVETPAAEIESEPDRSAEEEERWERCRAVDEAVQELPEKLRAPMLLRHWEGWSCGRIAARLGITANAVSLRLSRARGLLEKRLGPRFG